MKDTIRNRVTRLLEIVTEEIYELENDQEEASDRIGIEIRTLYKKRKDFEFLLTPVEKPTPKPKAKPKAKDKANARSVSPGKS